MKLQEESLPTSNEAKPVKVMAFGLESVGKTSLLSALAKRPGRPEGIAGSTLYCETFGDGKIDWIDAPGLLRDSDTETIRETVSKIPDVEVLLLVARADQAAEDIAYLAPLAKGKRVLVALTFRDKIRVDAEQQRIRLNRWTEQLGVPVVLLDGRSVAESDRTALRDSVDKAGTLGEIATESLPTWEFKGSKEGDAWRRVLDFPLVSLALLFAPTWIAVSQANAFADRLFDQLASVFAPLLETLNSLPTPFAEMLGGDYGVVAMLPFLLLYALPTIVCFSLLIAFYKSTGLMDRIAQSLHPWLRPFGLGARDLTRVIMGFGCNVPAVVSTRACHSCTRSACVSAISFGSACSYQLPATLAVFAAAGVAWLGVAYIGVLGLTSLIYLRFTTPQILRDANNRLLTPQRGALHAPNWGNICRETLGTLRSFFMAALPIFVGICFVAALLQVTGVLNLVGQTLGKVMVLFNLPAEAAIAVAMGSVRKDGLAIGLLDSDWGALKVALESPTQVLTAVYLAGVLLPCLVTLLTIGREMGGRFAGKLALRQAAWAAGFSVALAWGGTLFEILFIA